MADLVVGLAKSVVEGVLSNAQAAIEEEAKLRQSAQRDLVFITGEFQMMQSFLKVANVERKENLVVMTWVRQIRELAYDVEDCIEFVVHLDKKASWWFRMIPSCFKPALPLDEAVDEIEQLKARVADVSKRNTRYSLISDTGSKPVIMPQEPAASGAAVALTTSDMLAEARGVTKRQQGFSDLTRLITEKKPDNNSGLQVISVWGAAGDHGTTTIVRKTYNHPEICQDFPCRSWVKIMHPFSPHQFMSNMMAQFYATSCMEQRATIGRRVLANMEDTREDLFSDFEMLITGKRYLIVLEGLSHMVDWDAIRALIPDMKNGSWIIVSTQQSEIATLCIGHSCQVVELRKFSDQHSVCALYKGTLGKEPMETHVRKEKIKLLHKEAEEWRKKNDLLVGRKSTVHELAQYPSKARINSPPVMSVWGIAGVGKSALVKNLFYDTVLPDAKYQDYYWVDISRPFNMRDLYLTLLSDFHSNKDPTEECHRLLEKYRCLVVINGLQSTKEWDLIQPSLVSKGSKSVIIVITTEASIAKHCTNNEGLVFNVKALESAAAFDLFKKQVIEKNQSYPLKDQDEELKYLISKSGGLPRIISAIAELLLASKAEKRMDIIRSWNHKFMHHLETDPKYDNLQDLFGWMHSYFRTCPDALKPCIFYLSIFPQDQIIRRRRLVRRWIAEGYSRDSQNESAEENGEKHFSELLELSIIQQLSSQSSSSSSVNSSAFSVDAVRMVRCQVNGFIREYVVSRRMEENLVFELGDKCALTTERTGRHLVILKEWKRDRIVFESMDFSRLRSLTVFGMWKSFFISESMKMLRVLDLEDASGLNDVDLVKMVEWLRRLKLLSLRGCHEICHLPSSVGDLRQLQTLDVRNTSIVSLPKSVTKLQKLQYIRAGSGTMKNTFCELNLAASVPPVSSRWLPKFCKLQRQEPLLGVVVPGVIGKLTALHTLGVINVTASGGKAFLEELKEVTQLRKLGVSSINMKNSKEFVSVIEGHGHLESLSVQLDQDSQNCLDDTSLPWENLQSLKLYGLGDKLPLPRNQLSRLRKLALEMDTLMKNDIEFLAELPELCILRFRVKQQLQGGKLHFYAEKYGIELPTFEKVKILEIACSSSNLDVTFGSETMKNLELLKLDCSGETSYQLTGLYHLSELKQVVLKGTRDEALKEDIESQLANHPKRPVVKLEELPCSS